jgi:ABC-type enterochelin transport system ATPase subunit
METYDFYSKAREIARKLEKENLTDQASKVVDAISAGSTATEILMILRWELDQVLLNSPLLSGDIRNEIFDFICKVDEVLN